MGFPVSCVPGSHVAAVLYCVRGCRTTARAASRWCRSARWWTTAPRASAARWPRSSRRPWTTATTATRVSWPRPCSSSAASPPPSPTWPSASTPRSSPPSATCSPTPTTRPGSGTQPQHRQPQPTKHLGPPRGKLALWAACSSARMLLLCAHCPASRLRGTALNSLVTVAHESCSAECLAPYLHPLLTALCTCLESHVPPPVQEIALEGGPHTASLCLSYNNPLWSSCTIARARGPESSTSPLPLLIHLS